MRYLIFLAALLLPLAASAQTADNQNSNVLHQNYVVDNNQKLQRVQVSSNKSFRLSYTPTPDPIPTNQHFRLKLLLQDKNNQMITGAKLKLDATMPDHNHGMNVKPKLKELGKGIYAVEGFLFHMPGYWEIKATIQHAGKTETVVFGVNVELKPTATEHHHHH